MHMQDLEKWCH